MASAAAATESGEAKPDLRDGGVELIEAVSALVGGAILTPGPSSGGSEELQRDVVGIPERKPEPLARLLWIASPEVAAARPWMPTCAQQDERWRTEHADITEQQRAAAAFAEHVAGRAPMFSR